jgi:hypothetical protein
MYISNISSSSEGSSRQTKGNATASRRFDTRKMIRGEKVRRKLCKCMEFFLVEGGSCSGDDESIGDIEVPLRYKYLVK